MLVPLDENPDPIQHIDDLTRLLSVAAAALTSMADPLSIAASVTGILAFTAATARSLATLVLEIRDAPDDISVLARDVKSLAAVLITAQDLCVRHGIGAEDEALAAALTEYLEVCQESMQGLRLLLKPFASPSGGGRKSPVRFVLGWTMKKGEVRALRGRLNEGKASLNLTLSALNGVLEGKGQEDIRADISRAFVQLTSDFRNLEAGIRVKNRVEDDAVSVSTRRGRRPSMSTATDAGFAMRRYMEQRTDVVKGQPEEEVVEVAVSSHTSIPPATFLSPWSGEPAAIFDAVRSRNIPLVRSLIAQGAALSARMGQGYGSTVLHHCAVADDAEMAAILADNGADVNAKDNDFRSPLQLALVSESLLVARLLVERGCVISDTVPALLRLMSRAEGTGMDALARALHGRLASTTRGPFLVHVAISENTPVALATLLDAGFSASSPDERGLSPLFHTLFEDKRPMLRILVEHGADPGEYVSREVLMDAGLPSSWYTTHLAGDLPRWTPLLLAAHCMRHNAIMTTLLDLGADPDQPIGEDGRSTALHTVCGLAYAAQGPILVRRGARLGATTRDDHGPMYWAAFCCSVDLLRCMIEHGGDVDARCRHDGETILMVAARRDQHEMVRLLLASRADASVRNLEGMTALDVARQMGHGGVAALLEAAGQ